MFNLEKLVGMRFSTIQALEKFVGCKLELSSMDIDSINLADFNLMGELDGYDIDIYFLYDRCLQLVITEVARNN